MMWISVIGGLVRLILGAVGGEGLFSDDQTTQIASALVLVGTAVWTVIQKLRAHDKLSDAQKGF